METQNLWIRILNAYFLGEKNKWTWTWRTNIDRVCFHSSADLPVWPKSNRSTPTRCIRVLIELYIQRNTPSDQNIALEGYFRETDTHVIFIFPPRAAGIIISSLRPQFSDKHRGLRCNWGNSGGTWHQSG